MRMIPTTYVRAVLSLALLGLGASAALSSSAGTSTAVFAASADAYVTAAAPTANDGGSLKLRADGDPSVVSYLRFTVTSISGPVTKAILSVHATSDLPSGVDVRAVHDQSWSEGAITSQNAPAPDANVITSSGPIVAGGWYNLDVTAAVPGNGTFDFALTNPSSRSVAFDSRESTSAPGLVVQYAGGSSTAQTTTVVAPTTTTSSTPTTTSNLTTTTPTTTLPAAGTPGVGPIRAAFYYPWFPSAWVQQGLNPFTHYRPTLGYYDGSASSVIEQQMRWMSDAGLNAAIASWWGPGSNTDLKVPTILSTLHASGLPLKLSLYYEAGNGVPSASTLSSDLDYIYSHYASDSSFLHVNGKPVLFVYNGGASGTSCSVVPPFKAASAGRFYLDLKVFTGFRNCADQPDSWHQYGPATASSWQKGYSYTVSPGFFKANESTARLARDPVRWAQNVHDMVASGEPWQLVTTFNEWGEGSSVEPAAGWTSASGAGTYLDALRQAIGAPTPPPPPPAPTTTTAVTTTAVTTTAVTTTTAATTTNVTTTTPTTTTTPAPPGSGPDPVVAAAGDIACGTTATNFNGGLGAKSACRQKWTSDLMLSMSNLKAVLPLGDVQYECGDAPDYAASYNPSWGRLKSITHWATGNHEYGQSCGRNDDSASNAYFGATNPKGWSSYDVGAWHVIVINSECSYGTGVTKVGGCNTGSPQEAWLKQDLAAHTNACTLAYWHEPRFSSGEHGDALQMNDIWNDLVAAHVDVVLSGHNHDYERFEPIGAAPAGQVQPNLDPSGIRAFVVGTGGKNHYAFAAAPLNGEVIRDASTFGVLKLTLHANSYDWQFVNDPGSGTFTDSGTAACH